MKSLEETYIQLTNTLRDLNQEIKQKLSSMHYCTGQEMQNLVQVAGGGATAGRLLRERFMSNLPAYTALKTRIGQEASQGWVSGLDGRRLWIRSEHAALNTLLQSAGAIVMKKGLTILHEYAKLWRIWTIKL
jgi:hypothetical protein